MKESSKKKLPRSTWDGHVENLWEMKKWQKRADAQKVKMEMEARKIDISTGDCTKSDLERVGVELWK